MARLTLPGEGTVVHVEGDLEKDYRDAGWTEVQQKATPEKPKSKRVSDN